MIEWNSKKQEATLRTGDLELRIEAKNGINPCSLRNTKTRMVYADRDYEWQGEGFPTLSGKLKFTSRSISLTGQLGQLTVTQTFSVPKGESGVIVEQIILTNPTAKALKADTFKCGFVKALTSQERDVRVCPVPYFRETNGQLQDFTLNEIAEKPSGFAGWAESWTPTPTWGADGWVWRNGRPIAPPGQIQR